MSKRLLFDGDIYDGVFAEAAIEEVFDWLHEANPAGVAFLHYFDHASGARRVACRRGLSQGAVETIEADRSRADLAGLDVATLPICEVASGAVPRAPGTLAHGEGPTTAWHVDVVRLNRPEDCSTLLTLAHPVDGDDSPHRESLLRLSEIIPHLARVLRLRLRRLREVETYASRLIGAVEAPVVLFAEGLAVVNVNEAAERYFGNARSRRGGGADGVSATITGEAAIANLLQEIGSGRRQTASTSFEDAGGNFVIATSVRLPAEGGALTRAERFAEGGAIAAIALVMRIAYRSGGRIAEEAIRAYRITPAEHRLLEGLLSGKTMAEIASSNQVSYNTLRNQLASVTEKTGLRRQADVIRFLTPLT